MSGAQFSRRVLGHVAALAGVFVALAAWTWGTWPDVLVDFGRELYVPWRLVEGEQLYRDIAYFNGPLSPHWNALLFRVFGVGLATLVWSNLALFAGLLALLHYVLRSLATPFAATAACVLVMCVSGFGQLVGIGNYNFVCPYSHEVTHGLLLGVAALACVQRARDRAVWIALAGACVGLAFLTKPETFTAAVLGVTTWLCLRPRTARNLAIACVAALVPIVIAWLSLALTSSSEIARTGTLGAWPSLFSSDVSELAFYRTGMGLDAPAANASVMLLWSLGIAALLVPSALFARFASSRIAGVVAFALTAGVTLALHTRVSWMHAARAWPLLTLAIGVFAFTRWRRERSDDRAAGAVAFAVFALVLLGKMLLNARTIHYGFALTLPATALIVIALDWLPTQLVGLRIHAPTMRAGAFALLIGFAYLHVAISSKMLARKDISVASHPDTFRTDLRGRFVAEAVRWTLQNVAIARPTLVVLPEGVTINYLMRLDNPTPYINFMPPELELFGQGNIVTALEAHPPDVVLLVHKNTAEYGLPWFGRDYAQEVKRWVDEHYRVAKLFGDPPLQPGSVFGIAVLVRK